MNKILITGCAVATAFAAVAMPTKTELAQAQKPVENATKADLAAFKAGQKTAKEVAESHLALAAKAETQAEKYLYYQGAFKLYARSGEYSRAIDTLETLKRDVKDVTPEVINELVGQELRGVARDKAERTVASHGKKKEGPASVGKETVGAYTWSYRVSNGEATIMAEEKNKDGKINSACAISPKPTGVVEIPATLGGVKVTSIGGGAFTWCGDLSEVVIPSGVRSIEGGAFMNSGLKSVKIPEGVTTIGHGAFAWIGGLKSVEIPSSVTNIGGVAFISSSELESFHVAADNPAYSSRNGMLCTKDGSTLLAGINGEVVIPDGVTRIGGNAFHRCGRLKSVTVSAGVTNIHSQAFFGCGGLTSVTMLGERPKVADNAFERCDKLKAIHVPANAKSWAGMKEWQGIPLVFDGKETVNGYAWPYWLKDGEATIAAKLGGYSSVLSPAPTGHVVIPSTLGNVKVTRVGGPAFYWCDGMTSVSIPESVTSIDYGAFQRCGGLKSVTIPASVRKIEGQAFYGCGGLEKVIMCGERPEVGYNTFHECGKLKEIHVPANAKSWAGMKEWQGIPLVFDAK